jgi:hypothetical protein
MTRRAVVGLLLAALSVTSLSACKRDKDEKILLNRIIARTERLARAFVVTDQSAAKTEVSGIIEDDFRYKARLRVNGRAIADEVAKDDALAERLLQPDALPQFLNPDASVTAAAAQASKPGQIPVLTALRTRRWVTDPVGAPQTERVASDRRAQGDDPFYDALSILQFTREAVERARFVQKYSRDRIDPAFKSDEDVFPQPSTNSPITRYDIAPPKLPGQAQRGAGTNQELPETAHFRRMVVYVRDNRVIEIREVIDVRSKLDDLITRFNLPKGTTADEAIFAINAVRKGNGSDPIRVRKLVVEFSRFGESLKVDMPTESVEGNLNVLRYRGRQQSTQQASA